jgi:hypothetical protein
VLILLFTLIITWISRNWWKLLLLLVAIIVIHEYMLRKISREREAEQGNKDEDSLYR